MPQKNAIIIATGMDNTQMGSSIRSLVDQVKNSGKEIERGFMPESMISNVAEYYRKAGKAAGTAFKEGQSESKAEGGMGGFLAETGPMIAGAIGTEAVNRLIERAENIRNQMSTTGFSSEGLQRTQRAGEMIGLDPEKSTAAMERLNTQIGEAVSGSKEAQANFEKWGISIDGQSNEQIFAAIADKMASMQDPAERAAMAVDLMGKAGEKLVPLLENGAAALKKMGESGPILSEEDLQAIETLHQTIRTFVDYLEVGLGKLFGLVSKMAQFFGSTWDRTFGYKGVDMTDKGKSMYAEAMTGKGVEQHPAVVAARKEAEIKDTSHKKERDYWNDRDKVNEDNARAAETEARKQEERDRQARERQAQADADVMKLRELRDKSKAEAESGTFLSLEQLAGTAYTAGLARLYGAGGRYDLGQGNSAYAGQAQELERLQYATQFDRLHGAGKDQIDWDISRMTQLKQNLIDAGLRPDDLSAKRTADETAATASHLQKLVEEGAVINTRLATAT